MSTTVDLQQMSMAKKLRLMEALWDDLSRGKDTLEVPRWHKDILDERERLIASGEEKFVDWEIAKQQLRQELQ